MATRKPKTITTIISPDTLCKIIPIDGESFTFKHAARILDIDVATLRKRQPNTKIFPGYADRRIPRAELLRLLADDGIRPEPDQAPLPRRIQRKIAQLRAEASVA